MSKSPEQAGKREPRFEEALVQIEEVIERIESGEMGLEESIASYERGMKLLSRCQNVLRTLEQKVSQLTVDAGGKLKVSVADEIEVAPEEEAEETPAPKAKTKDVKPRAAADPSAPKPAADSGIAEEDIPF